MEDSGGATTGASTGAMTTVAEDTTSAVTTAAASTGDDGTEDTGFDPPEPMCGNGYVEGDEECDDGNEDDDDACNNACQVPCGLEWSELVLGPTLDSVIQGRSITTDTNDQVILSGLLREVTVQMDGTVLEGDDSVLVQQHMPGGGLVWEQVLFSPLDDAAPAGVAVDGAGDVYVAATLDAADGGRAIRVTKLASLDGAELWAHDFDGSFPGEDEIATGIAVGPDGQPVVAGTVRAGDGDDDIWVRKLEAADGSEVWTSTYSGVGGGGFSTDDGGPVAVAGDGTIYVLGRIYESFSTSRGTVLRFEAGGGPAAWTYTPVISGSNQSFTLEAITVAEDGGPLMAVSRVDGSEVAFWLYKLDDNGSEQWSLTRADFEEPGVGTDWTLEGLATAADEIVVLGRYVNDQQLEGFAWWEPWVSRRASDGAPRCQARYQVPFEGLLPTALRTFAVATDSQGSALATGVQDGADESALWLGSFRP